MRVKGFGFPHPLLQKDGDDYIGSSFDIDINEAQTTIVDNNIVIAVDYSLVCESLKNLIENGLARATVTIQCAFLSYRESFAFAKEKTAGQFEIPKDSVGNKLEIIGYIVATESMKSFSMEELNPAYYNSVNFSIRKGDILAVSTQKDIPIDDSELEKPLSSIFSISKADGLDTAIYPVFEGQKIEIKLSPDAYDIYYNLKDYNSGSYRRALHGLIVLPVLTEALNRIIENLQHQEYDYDENNEIMFDKRWYRAIDKKLQEKNIDLREPNEPLTSIASKLLGNVVFEALKAFKNIIDDELSGEEIIRIEGDI